MAWFRVGWECHADPSRFVYLRSSDIRSFVRLEEVVIDLVYFLLLQANLLRLEHFQQLFIID